MRPTIIFLAMCAALALTANLFSVLFPNAGQARVRIMAPPDPHMERALAIMIEHFNRRTDVTIDQNIELLPYSSAEQELLESTLQQQLYDDTPSDYDLIPVASWDLYRIGKWLRPLSFSKPDYEPPQVKGLLHRYGETRAFLTDFRLPLIYLRDDLWTNLQNDPALKARLADLVGKDAVQADGPANWTFKQLLQVASFFSSAQHPESPTRFGLAVPLKGSASVRLLQSLALPQSQTTTSPEPIRLLDWQTTLESFRQSQTNGTIPPTLMDEEETLHAFTSGNTFLMIHWNTAWNRLQSLHKDSIKHSVRFAPLPTAVPASWQPSPNERSLDQKRLIIHGIGLAIPLQSTQWQKAEFFLNWLASPVVQDLYAARGGMPSFGGPIPKTYEPIRPDLSFSLKWSRRFGIPASSGEPANGGFHILQSRLIGLYLTGQLTIKQVLDGFERAGFTRPNRRTIH